MKGVFRKELLQFFHSMNGYVYLSVFALISGVYFVTGNLLVSSGDVRDYFSSLITAVMLMTPMLTMKTFAEEKKQHTDQLLLLSPQSAAGITLGKFFATFAVYLLGLSAPLLHTAVLAWLGSFQGLMILGNFIGLMAAGAAFIAIGLLVSAMTENQIIACIVSYAILLVLWLAGFAVPYMPSPVLKRLCSLISPLSRFGDFAQGIFSLGSMVYYVSLTVYFLYLTVMRFGGRKNA